MIDRKISAVTTAAYALWGLALGLVITAMLTDVKVGQLGLLTAGLAMVTNVRGFFCTFLLREKEAFRLGLEAGKVRDLNAR